jgi:hypothetical protein
MKNLFLILRIILKTNFYSLIKVNDYFVIGQFLLSILLLNCVKTNQDNGNKLLVVYGLLSTKVTTAPTTTNPYLYVSITTHSEEGIPDPIYDTVPGTIYSTYRSLTKSMVDTIYSKGAKLNYESDWRFLNAIKLYDTASVMSDTNNKNLLRYIKEDKGFEVDAHAHESNENYADIAYRMTLLGVTPSDNIGGFTYNATSGNATDWETMQNSLTGRVNTSYSKKFTTLVLAGSSNHTADDKTYGAWKPKSKSEFYTHDPSKNLTFIGGGCDNVVTSTSTAADHIATITKISDGIKNGTYANGNFYATNIMLNTRDYSADYIAKVGQIIDGLKSRVDAKDIQWVFHSEKKTAWETIYGSKNFQFTCP